MIDVIIFENGCFGGVNNGRDIFNEKIRVIGNTYENQQLIPPTTRKEWRIVPDESCHECGDCILAETPFNYPHGLWDDSAKVKCSACNKSGWLSVDEWGINHDFST